VAELKMGGNYVIDYKTPIKATRAWQAQLAAYKHLVDQVVPVITGIALQLDPTGKPAKAVYLKNYHEALAGYISALNAYRYFKS
jgi:hypothetical protein